MRIETISDSPRTPCPAAAEDHENPAEQMESETLSSRIVRACQQGERWAQEQLYRRTHANIFRLMVRMVGAEHAADLTQEVFLQVFRKIGQFSGRSRLETWLYRLAVNEALQYLRREKRWQPRVLREEPIAEGGQEAAAAHRELMESALARLDPETRALILMREIEHLSYVEIAEVLQIAEGTVGSRLNRARRELKQYLIDLGWEP